MESRTGEPLGEARLLAGMAGEAEPEPPGQSPSLGHRVLQDRAAPHTPDRKFFIGHSWPRWLRSCSRTEQNVSEKQTVSLRGLQLRSLEPFSSRMALEGTGP